MNSQSFSLNLTDWKKALKGLLIATGGAILYTASVWVQGGSFDLSTLWFAEKIALYSALVNFGKLFFQGGLNNKIK